MTACYNIHSFKWKTKFVLLTTFSEKKHQVRNPIIIYANHIRSVRFFFDKNEKVFIMIWLFYLVFLYVIFICQFSPDNVYWLLWCSMSRGYYDITITGLRIFHSVCTRITVNFNYRLFARTNPYKICQNQVKCNHVLTVWFFFQWNEIVSFDGWWKMD